MLNETFYLDGIDARSAGIQLQAPIEFSEAVPIVEIETIKGRNGDLVYYTGSYENRGASASCFCLQKNVEMAVSSATRFLMAHHGYRRLETSDDPDHYWMARVENSPQISSRLRTLSPFEIGFDCKPQRFLKDGNVVIEFAGNGSLYNPYGQVALPIIEVHGQGSGWLHIGDIAVEILYLDNTLTLDCETQNAYNNTENQNMYINAPVFPRLFDGDNKIRFSGDIEKIDIIPRWWEL